MTTATTERNRRKMRMGKVVSDRMDKTVVVSIERLVKHSTYGRYVRRRGEGRAGGPGWGGGRRGGREGSWEGRQRHRVRREPVRAHPHEEEVEGAADGRPEGGGDRREVIDEEDADRAGGLANRRLW